MVHLRCGETTLCDLVCSLFSGQGGSWPVFALNKTSVPGFSGDSRAAEFADQVCPMHFAWSSIVHVLNATIWQLGRNMYAALPTSSLSDTRGMTALGFRTLHGGPMANELHGSLVHRSSCAVTTADISSYSMWVYSILPSILEYVQKSLFLASCSTAISVTKRE